MLASPEPTAQAVMGPHGREPRAGGVDGGSTIDGIRAQIHLGAGRAEIFARDLETPITGQFADLLRPLRACYIPAKRSPDRLKISAFEEVAAGSPFRPAKAARPEDRGRSLSAERAISPSSSSRAFDLLFLDGIVCCSAPRQPSGAFRHATRSGSRRQGCWKSRRSIEWPRPRTLRRPSRARRPAATKGRASRTRASPYTQAGARAQAWLKCSAELGHARCRASSVTRARQGRSLPCAERLHARRARHLVSGQLLTTGKAYSDPTDEEIEELTEDTSPPPTMPATDIIVKYCPRSCSEIAQTPSNRATATPAASPCASHSHQCHPPRQEAGRHRHSRLCAEPGYESPFNGRSSAGRRGERSAIPDSIHFLNIGFTKSLASNS